MERDTSTKCWNATLQLVQAGGMVSSLEARSQEGGKWSLGSRCEGQSARPRSFCLMLTIMCIERARARCRFCELIVMTACPLP
jgi:hypothetical protein